MLRNDVQPSYFQSANRVIVIGDVHGDLQTFMKIMYAAKLFNTRLEWIAEPRDTIVVQLGDQIDSMNRGGRDESWEVVPDIEMIYMTDHLDMIARMNGGRVISLLGNHEIMNTIGDFSYVSPASSQRIDVNMRKRMFQPGGTLSHILAKRNVVLRIGHHLFCHGGLLPNHLFSVENNLHCINDVTRKFLQNIPLSPKEEIVMGTCIFNNQSVVWTRMYVEMLEANKQVLEQIVDAVLNNTNCIKIFVGHNTVQQVSFVLNGKIVFTDVGLSRAYPDGPLQFVEIKNIGMPNESIQVNQLQ